MYVFNRSMLKGEILVCKLFLKPKTFISRVFCAELPLLPFYWTIDSKN